MARAGGMRLCKTLYAADRERDPADAMLGQERGQRPFERSGWLRSSWAQSFCLEVGDNVLSLLREYHPAAAAAATKKGCRQAGHECAGEFDVLVEQMSTPGDRARTI